MLNLSQGIRIDWRQLWSIGDRPWPVIGAEARKQTLRIDRAVRHDQLEDQCGERHRTDCAGDDGCRDQGDGQRTITLQMQT